MPKIVPFIEAPILNERRRKRKFPKEDLDVKSINIDENNQEISNKINPDLPRIFDKNIENSSGVYDEAKRYFHRATRVRMVGRTAERAVIQKFWQNAKEGSGPQALYICGNPGTGKTALVDEMLPELLAEFQPIVMVKENCMMYDDPRQAIVEAFRKSSINQSLLSLHGSLSAKLDAIIEFLLGPLPSTIVLVLDEVDQLALKDPALLQRIFSISRHRKEEAMVIIIGIANSLDLSTKYFDDSHAHVAILNFSPYSMEDIQRILLARAELVTASIKMSLVSSIAIEMCARKVSAVGDLRKALEVMREALVCAEKDYKISSQSSPVQVGLPHVAKAMEHIFGSTVRTTGRHTQMISDLNLHQKILLATLGHLLKDHPELRPTVQVLFDQYTINTRRERLIDSVNKGEFNDILGNIESMGVIALVAAGRRKASTSTGSAIDAKTKVLLTVPLEDLFSALRENPLLRMIIDPSR